MEEFYIIKAYGSYLTKTFYGWDFTSNITKIYKINSIDEAKKIIGELSSDNKFNYEIDFITYTCIVAKECYSN